MSFDERRKKLLVLLKEFQLDGCLVTAPIDIFYLTGIKISSGHLIITMNQTLLFVDGRYFESCRHHQEILVQLFQSEKWIHSLKGIKKLGIDSESVSVKKYLELKNQCESFFIEIIPTPSLVKILRSIKDEREIQALRRSAELGVRGFEFIKNLLHPGLSEQQVKFDLERFWRDEGADGFAFDPIIAFGKNSAFPHHRAGKSILEKNSMALIDIGVTFQDYHSDMTRVIFFGNVPDELLRMRDIVEEAAQLVFEKIKPEIFPSELDTLARSYFASKNYGEYFTHSLGHGIGLEVHELPMLKQGVQDERPLSKNCVITVEPGIYVSDLGGIRLEDTVVVTENGYENLTNLPRFIHV